MPLHYEIRGQALFGRSHGVLSDADAESVVHRIASDPMHLPGCWETWDLSEYSELQITSAGVRTLVALDEHYVERFEGGRIAIVAPTDIVFGMARMYQTLSDLGPYQVGVFRSGRAAKDWMNPAQSSIGS